MLFAGREVHTEKNCTLGLCKTSGTVFLNTDRPAGKSHIAGFHLTSWQPCWSTLTKEFWLFLLFGTPTWPLYLLSFVSLGIVWNPRIFIIGIMLFYRKLSITRIFHIFTCEDMKKLFSGCTRASENKFQPVSCHLFLQKMAASQLFLEILKSVKKNLFCHVCVEVKLKLNLEFLF